MLDGFKGLFALLIQNKLVIRCKIVMRLHGLEEFHQVTLIEQSAGLLCVITATIALLHQELL